MPEANWPGAKRIALLAALIPLVKVMVEPPVNVRVPVPLVNATPR